MSNLPRSLMSLADLSPDQIYKMLALARRLKHLSRSVLPPTGAVLREANWIQAEETPSLAKTPPPSLRNMSVALLFSKRSTRTRVAAETASKLLGGQAIFLGQEDIQLGVNESVRDTARVLSGMCQGIFARVGEHSEIEELAKYAEVPVINALSSLWHPTQVLADIMTLEEVHSLQGVPTKAPNPYIIPYSSQHNEVPDSQTPAPNSSEQAAAASESTDKLTSSETPTTENAQSPAPGDASSTGSVQTPTSNYQAAQHRVTQKQRNLRPLTIAYVGDSANVLHDMLVTYPRLGHKLQIASPPNPRYRAPTPVWDKVVQLECDKGITWTEDPREAVQGADVVVTDTWISMGQEAEYEQRVKDFQGYQVTEKLCEGAKPEWKFLHCLPRKSHEVDDEVFYGPRSLVFDEADNRKWTIMALFHTFFGGGSYSALPHGRPRPSYTPGQKGKNGAWQKKGQNKSAGGATKKDAQSGTAANTTDEIRPTPQLSEDEKMIFDKTLDKLIERAQGREVKSIQSADPASSAASTENKA